MSIYRRAGSRHWWIRFQIGNREVRQSTGTQDRAQAEEFEHEIRTRYWREIRLGEKFYTLKEATDRWLRERATKRSLKRDRSIIHEYRALAATPIRDLTRDALSALRTTREQAVTKSTVNREFALLRAILNVAAAEWGWLESAPKVPMARIEAHDPRFATRAQFATLCKYLPKHSAEMARLAVSTGLRRANITGLTWDRVNIKAGFAYVPGSQAKAKRGIPVPLNADATAVLKRQMGRHETHVFCFRGKPIKDVTTKAWREAAKKAGMEGFRFHDLRHTWASWQAQAGTPMYALRELGGWSTEAMVRRYAHLSPGDLATFANRSQLNYRPKAGTVRKRLKRKSA